MTLTLHAPDPSSSSSIDPQSAKTQEGSTVQVIGDENVDMAMVKTVLDQASEGISGVNFQIDHTVHMGRHRFEFVLNPVEGHEGSPPKHVATLQFHEGTPISRSMAIDVLKEQLDPIRTGELFR